mmetsp:Transcript_111247/g.181425  ORF Transcript_111247/g.181425 Transcript_111247/m.181425 type:complete len:109 (+) Transcript_111247:430-756(+)
MKPVAPRPRPGTYPGGAFPNIASVPRFGGTLECMPISARVCIGTFAPRPIPPSYPAGLSASSSFNLFVGACPGSRDMVLLQIRDPIRHNQATPLTPPQRVEKVPGSPA